MTQQTTISYDHFEVVLRPDGSPWVLGKGAMGVTYKAFDNRLQCHVALKVIQSSLFANNVAKERFLREARSAAAVNHPNVASVFYLGQAGEDVFYAMELVEGVSLEEELRTKGVMDAAFALTLAIQICRALHALNRAGLVHRDIKPANIMLLNDGDGQVTAKLVDFGLAKSVGGGLNEATLSMGGFLGTPYYASPEQINEQDVDTRSDIYSLGATLFVMLSGQPPFSGTLAVVLDKSLHQPPPLDLVQEALRDLLGKMLAKRPEDRFQNPQELRSSLEAALQRVSLSSQTPDDKAASVQPAATVPAVVPAAAAPGAKLPTSEVDENSGTRFSLLELLKKRRALPLAEALVVLEAVAGALDRIPSSGNQITSRSLAHIIVRGTNLSAANVADCTDMDVLFQVEDSVVPDATINPETSENPIMSHSQLLANLAYELLGGYHQSKERWTPVPALSAAGNTVLRQGMEGPKGFATASDFVAALKPQQPRRQAGRQPRTVRKASLQTSSTTNVPPEQSTNRGALLPFMVVACVFVAVAGAAVLFFSTSKSKTAGVPSSSEQPVVAQSEPAPESTPTPEAKKPAEDPAAPFLRAAEEARASDDTAGMLENFSKALDASPQLEEPSRQMEMVSAKLRSNAVKLTRQKFEVLRKPLEGAAAHNVVSAQVLLGEKLRTTDPREALKWFTAAAANGQTEAMTQAGLMMANGLGREKPDFAAAVGWFQQGAAAGDSDSMVSLADCYLYGKGVARNELKAVEILRTAAALNHPHAMNTLGDLLKKGLPGLFPPDGAQAARLFASAMAMGNWEAQANLGVMYANGQGVPKDFQNAFDLWKEGAEKRSNPTCMYFYAVALEGGLVGEKRPDEARDWYARAAKAGNAQAAEWCRRNNVSFAGAQ